MSREVCHYCETVIHSNYTIDEILEGERDCPNCGETIPTRKSVADLLTEFDQRITALEQQHEIS